MHPEIAELLLQQARLMNSPEFIGHDPVQFPRLFTDLPDIELAALLSATIAWGNRQMICRDCAKMLALMDHQPYRYLMDGGYEELPEGNIHRTFFNRDLRYFLRGLHPLYERYGSLQAFAKANGVAASEAPAWTLVELLNCELRKANGDEANSRCLPQNVEQSALKRVNMALRWLVRRDGIVDLGVWDLLTPAQLFIPLDVHVGRTARTLGLLQRRSNDRRAVVELTETLRTLDPRDPVRFDFALFGISLNGLLNDPLPVPSPPL